MNSLNANINKLRPISCMIIGLIILNYLGFQVQSALSFIIFCSFFFVLFFTDIVCAFVFAYTYHVNVVHFSGFSWLHLVSFTAMFLTLFRYKESYLLFKENRSLKPLFIVAILFMLFVLFINLLGKGASPLEILRTSGYYLGFFTFIPAYYLALRFRKKLFSQLTLIAALFLCLYYCDLYFKLGIMHIGTSSRGDDFEITRIMGYDVRQFMIFYTYLLPATIFMDIGNKKKAYLIVIAIFSYLIIILAVYRLAIFYVAMGALTTFFFVARYINLSKLFMRISVITLVLIAALFLAGNIIDQYTDIFQWTLNSFSSGSSDESANIRFMIQLPILQEMFNENMLTGAGLQTLLDEATENGMFGLVDLPILGTLAAFGIIGMFLYYFRFYIILSKKTSEFSRDKLFISKNKNDFFFFIALKAYFITMITYRLFYISWELTFEYQQAEFGLFVGAYFALHKILHDKYRAQINYEETKNGQ